MNNTVAITSDKNELQEQVRRRLLKEADELYIYVTHRHRRISLHHYRMIYDSLGEWRAVFMGPPDTVYDVRAWSVLRRACPTRRRNA